HGFERHQELVDRQIYSQFGVAVLFGERARHIDDDINPAALLHDTSEISINGSIIERINYVRSRCTARLDDFVSYVFQIQLGPPSQEDSRALCCKFLCDGGADRTACTEHYRVLSL